MVQELTSTLETSLQETPTTRVRVASVDDAEAHEVKTTETNEEIGETGRNQAGQKPQLRPVAGLVLDFSMTIWN